METINSMIKGYTNNLVGTVLGIGAGYLLARKLGYEKKITLVPFLVVGSIVGMSAEHYIKAKKGMPTAEMTK